MLNDINVVRIFGRIVSNVYKNVSRSYYYFTLRNKCKYPHFVIVPTSWFGKLSKLLDSLQKGSDVFIMGAISNSVNISKKLDSKYNYVIFANRLWLFNFIEAQSKESGFSVYGKVTVSGKVINITKDDTGTEYLIMVVYDYCTKSYGGARFLYNKFIVSLRNIKLNFNILDVVFVEGHIYNFKPETDSSRINFFIMPEFISIITRENRREIKSDSIEDFVDLDKVSEDDKILYFD